MVTTTSSSAMRSSICNSASAGRICVRRSSEYCSLISTNSCFTICRTIASDANMVRKWAMRETSSLYSWVSLSCSSWVKRCSRISRMAVACTSLKVNWLIRPCRAVSGEDAPRMRAMTSSRNSRARLKPSKMWARSSALRRSYAVRRITTSLRCSRNAAKICLRVNTSGRFPTRANMMTPKVVCIWVCL